MDRVDEIYIYLHNCIAKQFGDDDVSRKEVEKFLGRVHHYSKPMPIIILKKMENFGLIEFTSRDLIRISKKPVDLLENRSVLFKSVGCF